MAELNRTEIFNRLRSLPRQLLLAVFNATIVLVIVAAVLALVAISRIDHFAENAAATMTEAMLSKIDLPAKKVLANLQNLSADVRKLEISVREFRTRENSLVQVEIARLDETLTALIMSVDRLANARSTLTDEAIVRLGQAVTDMLLKLRHCSSDKGQMVRRHSFRSNAVEN